MRIQILCEPEYENCYWLRNIMNGIRLEASCAKMTVEKISELEADGNGAVVCIIGTGNKWLYDSISKANDKGYRPMLISSGAPTFHNTSCSLICFDLYDSTINCIKYLIGSGRKRIAALGFRPLLFCDRVKQKAFNDAVTDFGLSSCRDIPFDDDNADSFAENLDYFVGSFDAVICSTDTLAVYLIRLLKEHGYDVPRSLYVIGMGNSNIGQSFMVPLTSVFLDYEKLGKQAVRFFKHLTNNPSVFHETSYLKTELIIRDTTDNTPYEATPICSSPYPSPLDNEGYKSRIMKEILDAESFLQECDETDRQILLLLLKGLSYEEIAAKLFIHIRTLSYRKTKMLKRLGASTRKEFCAILGNILYP